MKFHKILHKVSKDLKAERNKIIMTEHRRGKTNEEIAKILNIHHSTVHNVIRHFNR